MLPSIQIESLLDAAQTKVPFTFGHVFALGDLSPTDGLKAGALALQVDVKATHADGSVRHAIISGVLPSLAARATTALQLAKGTRVGTAQVFTAQVFTAQVFTGASAVFTATIGGVAYTAAIDPMTPHSATWLAGSVVNERQYVVPLAAGGVPHPHLVARFAVRDYGTGMQRVDLTVENNWAYEPGPQNFTYDAKLVLAGKVVYQKAGLVHLHHSRWRKVFWVNPDPKINVKLDPAYLIATRAVPNYDQSFGVAPSLLSAYGAAFAAAPEPMTVGLATAYMPMTGAHNDIGILPMWAAAYVLSMDARARDATLLTSDLSGSFSIHYRDQKTDRALSVKNYPYATFDGRPTDTMNPVTRQYEAFPAAGGDTTTPYKDDTAHHPSLAYLPYLVTGDYFYLEEMQFWALWNITKANPNYRAYDKGLLISEQVRGQAWGLRTLAQAAYLTPDDDALKADLVGFVNNNLDWYNAEYANNPAANKLGIIVNGYGWYNNNTAVAPWQDDFFTQSVGYAVDLGFEKAKPLLAWKAKFPVGRMTAPGYCWVDGSPYTTMVRDGDGQPIYDNFAKVQLMTRGVEFTRLPCAGPLMAAALGAKVGDMGNISEGYMGYPSNMQPALAYAVDSGIPSSGAAWALFQSRTVKPDYSQGSQFSIVPRGAAPVVVVPPVVVPPAPAKPGKIAAPTSTKLAKLAGLKVAIVDTLTRQDVAVVTGVTATSKGAFSITNAALVPKKMYAYYVYNKTGAFVLTNSITAT